MPATLIVTFERRSQMASRIERLVETLPVRIVRTRSAPDFAAAIAGGPFPIAILEAEADPDLLPELVVEGRRYRGWVVIVGETGGWSRQMHLREAGAHCLITDLPEPGRWSSLLQSLVDTSQQLIQATG